MDLADNALCHKSEHLWTHSTRGQTLYLHVHSVLCVCLRFERSELVLLSVFRSCSTYRWSLSITDWKWGHSFKASAEKKSPNKRIAIHLKSSVILFEGFCQAVKHCSDFLSGLDRGAEVFSLEASQIEAFTVLPLFRSWSA